MRFKKYYKDILSLIAALSLLGTVYFVNHYDIKQLYREFATLSLKVKSQENQIKTLSSRVDLLAKQNQDLLIELENRSIADCFPSVISKGSAICAYARKPIA